MQSNSTQQQLHQKVMQRLSPQEAAAAAAGERRDGLRAAVAAAEPGLEALGSTRGSTKAPPGFLQQQQQQLPQQAAYQQAPAQQQGGWGGQRPTGVASKDPAAGPRPGADISGFAVPGVLSEPPPPINTLPGSGPGSVITSSGNGGSTSTPPPAPTAAASGAGAAAVGGDVPSWPPEIRALGNPSCVWLGEDQLCMPTQDNWLIPQGVPSSPYRRANLVAIARQRHCEGIRQEGPCWAAAAQRCYWHTAKDGKADCRSADLLEVFYYSDTGFAGTIFDIPFAMTCPGSKAAEFFRCFAHPAAPDHCDKLGPCFPVQQPDSQAGASGGGPQTICLPRLLAAMSSKEVDEFLAQLWALDARLYGNCQAACWIRQARVCRQLKASSRQECEGVAFCSYDRGSSRCLKRSLEFESDFDFKVKRLYGLCLDIDNAADCKVAEKTRPKPSNDWAAFKDQSEPYKCNVP